MITGSLSNDEIRQRSVHGFTQFVPPGFNERIMARAGLHVIETQDRTASLLRNAKGRLASRLAHRKQLEALEGAATFDAQSRYLETVIALSDRGGLSRIMFLGESRAPSRLPGSTIA